MSKLKRPKAIEKWWTNEELVEEFHNWIKSMMNGYFQPYFIWLGFKSLF